MASDIPLFLNKLFDSINFDVKHGDFKFIKCVIYPCLLFFSAIDGEFTGLSTSNTYEPT